MIQLPNLVIVGASGMTLTRQPARKREHRNTTVETVLLPQQELWTITAAITRITVLGKPNELLAIPVVDTRKENASVETSKGKISPKDPTAGVSGMTLIRQPARKKERRLTIAETVELQKQELLTITAAITRITVPGKSNGLPAIKTAGMKRENASAARPREGILTKKITVIRGRLQEITPALLMD